jgi:HSP20 family protein
MLSTMRSRFATPFDLAFEPWSDLRREIDRLFDATLSGVRQAGVRNGMEWIPPMDVEERDDAITLALELPGVSREQVQVTVENGVLTIAGEKKISPENGHESNGARFIERHFGRFERVLTLPQSVDAEKITANYENGVLTLTLPKSAESRRRKIEIGRGVDQKRIESEPKRIESGNEGSRKVA